MERLGCLVHAALQKLCLVKNRSIRDVLEHFCVVNHLLESFDAEYLFNFAIELVVVNKRGIDNDLVHQAFHDLLIFFLVKVQRRQLLLLRVFFAAAHILAAAGLDVLLVLAHERVADDFQCPLLHLSIVVLRREGVPRLRVRGLARCIFPSGPKLLAETCDELCQLLLLAESNQLLESVLLHNSNY